MTTTPAVRAERLTKRYGRTRVLDDVSFTARAGAVTGFLGPNGAGKTTAFKLLTGLARPDGGSVTTNGACGVFIEPCGAHPGRTGRAHLRTLATLGGQPRRRVEEVLDVVGLAAAAGRRVGGYSMGMRQRLGLAAALLADPPVLVLDEPVNGLDPQGVAWLRGLLREEADAGRAVLLASHSLAEAAAVADDVVVLDRGRVVHQGPLAELTRGRSLEQAFLELTSGVPR